MPLFTSGGLGLGLVSSGLGLGLVTLVLVGLSLGLKNLVLFISLLGTVYCDSCFGAGLS